MGFQVQLGLILSFVVPESRVLTYSLGAGSRLEAHDYGSSISLSLISPGTKQDQKRLNC